MDAYFTSWEHSPSWSTRVLLAVWRDNRSNGLTASVIGKFEPVRARLIG